MMIVIVTRDDLRDEFMMADDAFALSPISARAVQPSEEDYDAIRDAFMETSRGRWFLGEYAKRNRNTDTRMVLDAVARLEENLAAQRQAAADNGLAEALVAIRRAVDEARTAASGAIDSLALEEALAPVRKGVRVIREIAWRWREIGADGRICDLIDSQVNAIETGCGQISSTDPKAALNAAFDLIEGKIAELGDSDPASAENERASPSPTVSDEVPGAAAETVQKTSATNDAEVAVSAPAMSAEAVIASAEAGDLKTKIPDRITEADEAIAEAAVVRDEATEMTPEAADAEHDAVLDMIALEMAAPDPSDIHDRSEFPADEIHVAPPQPADTIIVARQAEATPPAAIASSLQALPQSPLQPSPQASLQPSLEPPPKPSIEPSLGSTLLASGILRKPVGSAPDPLAPIRRMSQVEKIAFFS